jgi:predicted PurR-regulated permease PerM
MMTNKLQINFFYILLVAVSILAFFIFLPYFQVLFLAMVLSVLFYPVYRWILIACFGGRSIAALITMLVIFIVIVAPLGTLGFFMFQEIKTDYVQFTQGGGSDTLTNYLGRAQGLLDRVLPEDLVPETTVSKLQDFWHQTYTWITFRAESALANTFGIVGNVVIFILALFFFLRDGERFRKALIKLSPLNNAYDQAIINKIYLAIHSVIKGSLLIAVLEGALTTVGFVLFGAPSPIVFGALAILFVLIPNVGIPFIVLPMSIFLYFSEGLLPAVELFVWGLIIMLFVDNVLRSILMKKGLDIHPFLILLSVVGGIGLLGPIGFLIGPVILSFLFALIEIHTSLYVSPSSHSS